LLATVLISPLVGVVTLLVTFNVVHVVIRFWGLRVGWRSGLGVGKALHRRTLQASIKFGEIAAPFAFGLATPVIAEQYLNGFDVGARVASLGAAAVTVTISRWLVPTMSAARLGTAAIVIALVIGSLWV